MEKYRPSAVTISESQVTWRNSLTRGTLEQHEDRVHDTLVTLKARSRKGFSWRIRDGKSTVGEGKKLAHRSKPGER
eukprot:scaffold4342_cov68-Cylindrotheca_fusiformis.AAC.3